MSISKSKNFSRKLQIMANEAREELDKVCESSHWQSLGFVYFDQLENKDKIAKANFYYGQLTLLNQISELI